MAIWSSGEEVVGTLNGTHHSSVKSCGASNVGESSLTVKQPPKEIAPIARTADQAANKIEQMHPSALDAPVTSHAPSQTTEYIPNAAEPQTSNTAWTHCGPSTEEQEVPNPHDMGFDEFEREMHRHGDIVFFIYPPPKEDEMFSPWDDLMVSMAREEVAMFAPYNPNAYSRIRHPGEENKFGCAARKCPVCFPSKGKAIMQGLEKRYQSCIASMGMDKDEDENIAGQCNRHMMPAGHTAAAIPA